MYSVNPNDPFANYEDLYYGLESQLDDQFAEWGWDGDLCSENQEIKGTEETNNTGFGDQGTTDSILMLGDDFSINYTSFAEEKPGDATRKRKQRSSPPEDPPEEKVPKKARASESLPPVQHTTPPVQQMPPTQQPTNYHTNAIPQANLPGQQVVFPGQFISYPTNVIPYVISQANSLGYQTLSGQPTFLPYPPPPITNAIPPAIPTNPQGLSAQPIPKLPVGALTKPIVPRSSSSQPISCVPVAERARPPLTDTGVPRSQHPPSATTSANVQALSFNPLGRSGQPIAYLPAAALAKPTVSPRLPFEVLRQPVPSLTDTDLQGLQLLRELVLMGEEQGVELSHIRHAGKVFYQLRGQDKPGVVPADIAEQIAKNFQRCVPHLSVDELTRRLSLYRIPICSSLRGPQLLEQILYQNRLQKGALGQSIGNVGVLDAFLLCKPDECKDFDFIIIYRIARAVQRYFEGSLEELMDRLRQTNCMGSEFLHKFIALAERGGATNADRQFAIQINNSVGRYLRVITKREATTIASLTQFVPGFSAQEVIRRLSVPLFIVPSDTPLRGRLLLKEIIERNDLKIVDLQEEIREGGREVETFLRSDRRTDRANPNVDVIAKVVQQYFAGTREELIALLSYG